MLVPTRNYSNPVYRYGFQGQEKDDEIKGAKKVTSKFEVGLVEYDPTVIPGLSVSMETKSFIINTGKYLLKNFTMPLMKEIIEKGTINGSNSCSMDVDMKLLIKEQNILEYRLEIANAKNPKVFEKIMREYNKGFGIMMRIKDDNNYLNLASDILGGKIKFNNLRDRLVMGMVLLYQGYDKEIDDSAKKEILEKATKESYKHVPIIPSNN